MDTDNLFGELDVESAEDNPWFKPDGTYRCGLADVTVKLTKNEDKMGMTLVFKVTQDFKKGRQIKPWYWIPTPNQIKGYPSLKPEEGQVKDPEFAEKAANATSTLKMVMKNMGVPADKINTLKSQDLMDMAQEYDVTIQNKNGSENIKSIAVNDDTTDQKFDPFS